MRSGRYVMLAVSAAAGETRAVTLVVVARDGMRAQNIIDALAFAELALELVPRGLAAGAARCTSRAPS